MQLHRDFMKKKNSFHAENGETRLIVNIQTPKVGVREVVK